MTDSLVSKINSALAPLGETLHAAQGKEIGALGRYYVVDHLGRAVQTHVCLSTLATDLNVLPCRKSRP